jgi:hypothetical protein
MREAVEQGEVAPTHAAIKKAQTKPRRRAMVALDSLPFLEKEAEARKLATLKQNATDSHRIDERNAGRASGHVAQIEKTNARYVADAKAIAKAPAVAEQVCAGHVTIPQHVRLRHVQDRRLHRQAHTAVSHVQRDAREEHAVQR